MELSAAGWVGIVAVVAFMSLVYYNYMNRLRMDAKEHERLQDQGRINRTFGTTPIVGRDREIDEIIDSSSTHQDYSVSPLTTASGANLNQQDYTVDHSRDEKTVDQSGHSLSSGNFMNQSLTKGLSDDEEVMDQAPIRQATRRMDSDSAMTSRLGSTHPDRIDRLEAASQGSDLSTTDRSGSGFGTRLDLGSEADADQFSGSSTVAASRTSRDINGITVDSKTKPDASRPYGVVRYNDEIDHTIDSEIRKDQIKAQTEKYDKKNNDQK